MSLLDVSRELLAQEIRELLPSVLVGAAFTASVFLGYIIGRVQMARKYSEKNMPEHAKKHIRYLALKLRVTEVERDELRSRNEGMSVSLRGVASLVLPFKSYVTKEIEDDALGNPTVVRIVHDNVKDSTKKLKLIKQ